MKIHPVLIVFASCATPAFAQVPSFDCSLATRPDEVTICADPQLSELEKTVSDAYQAAKDQLGKNLAKSIGAPILAHRRQCGSDAQCIYDVLQGALIKYQDAGIIAAAPQISDAATAMNNLINEWHDSNGACRDAVGAEDVNNQCGLRDQLAEQLNEIGLCQGNYLFDSPDFDMATILREHWVPCIYTELLN